MQKEMRKRMLDGDRLQVILDELREEGLRNVLDQGEAACMKHGGKNHLARSAMHSLATIGTALSELSLSLQNAFPSFDWADLKELRNYIAHDYLKREMPMVWDAVVAYTPVLEGALPRMIAWDADHPAPDPRDAKAIAEHGIPDYIKEAVARAVGKPADMLGNCGSLTENQRENEGCGGPGP